MNQIPVILDRQREMEKRAEEREVEEREREQQEQERQEREREEAQTALEHRRMSQESSRAGGDTQSSEGSDQESEFVMSCVAGSVSTVVTRVTGSR